MSHTPATTPLKPAVKNPHNIEANKYYIFNETGNIMMASTLDASQPMKESVQKVFAEVSVFFAGMTRAITTTINPATKKPYSLYNYHALEDVIGGSGLFVHVTEEDVAYSTQSVGMDFSKELLESLLGLATGAGELGFASAMIASIGKEGLRISESTSSSESKVGNIVFVCEYLLGMPIVSAIVVYADCRENSASIQAGPCFKAERHTSKWTLHKDTYLFVTPSFIHEYAGDLDSVQSDPNYLELINWLKGLVSQTPTITGVFDNDKELTDGDALTPGDTYYLRGAFLPMPEGTLAFSDGKGVLKVNTWSDGEITFTASGTQAAPATIGVIPKGEKTAVVTTSAKFGIKGKTLDDPEATGD